MSADKIDHKEQVTNLLASIHLHTGDVYDQTPEARSVRLSLAQVHATLYAAEQSSRIADALELLVGEQGIMPVEIINGNELR